MRLSTRRIRLLGLALAAVALGAWLTGCGRDSDKPKYIQRGGRVSSINKETGEVKMWYYHPKQKQEIEIAGKLDPNIEVFINGAAADVDDVKLDDKIVVTGRIERTDTDMQLIAVRVDVERPVTETIPATPEPAANR